MRLLSITAGAAGMYCGSCVRDNALAAELLARGHDVLLVPVYTPTRTDEPNVSRPEVFFGGISVYLEQHLPLFRRTPWALDRLWDSRLALTLAARHSISTDPHLLGELTLSVLKGEDGFQGKEIRKLVHWLQSEPAPDVISLPNSLLLGLAAPLGRALDRPVCCTLQGEDLFVAGLPAPHRQAVEELIRANVEHVDAFIAVSQFHAESMAEYLRIPAEKVHVVPLGITLDGYDDRPRVPSDPFTLGYFARLAPEKGLHLLCEAYRSLRERGELPASRLVAAGYLGAQHRSYLEGIQAQMHACGLGEEFVYEGVLDRAGKLEFLSGLDVLSVPAVYDEPKGMFLLEAMASGVPVVQPRRGAFTEIVEQTGGGLLVSPDDVDSLAEGILALHRDPKRAAALGAEGRRGVHEHFAVGRMADRALDVFGRVLERSSTEERRV